MPIVRSPDVIQAIHAMTQAWREGDTEAVLASAAQDASILMGNPGAFPAAVGPQAVAAVIESFVPMNRTPHAPKAFFPKVEAFAEGDFGWAYAEGYLDIPGKGRHGFRNALVLRREDGVWKWLQWCAFMPVPMQLMGTETLGFI